MCRKGRRGSVSEEFPPPGGELTDCGKHGGADPCRNGHASHLERGAEIAPLHRGVATLLKPKDHLLRQAEQTRNSLVKIRFQDRQNDCQPAER